MATLRCTIIRVLTWWQESGGSLQCQVEGAGALTTSRGLLARQQERPATRLGVDVYSTVATWHPPGQEVAGHPVPGPKVQQLLLGRVIHGQLEGRVTCHMCTGEYW